ncbi:polyhydroxyalkanoate synthesis regulator phasin [Catenuloplanes nepalensis]|uniref:Polyhydroxyalkanoate synthesis regulator phasin n=1 Tax=Catenuloplanes nepalensis TaxID=587533 RepID=A0ABT9MWZ4_9ACTN|nr:hypothetical protein [Catenuloplanes nepalensis]MDP9795904.1 polyhydroxyalkanoate synthesis regulator phasin [Catenuloplanes nepalensis]
MPKEAWRAYLDLALGLTESSRKQATKTAMKLVGKGGATAVQLQALVEDALAAGTANRAVVERLVRNEVDRALTVVGLAKSDEVAALRQRVAELEERLAAPVDVPGDLPVEPAVEAAVAASAATSTPAPSPVSSPVKKTIAKKIVAKKAVAKAPAGGTAVPDALASPETLAAPATPETSSPPATPETAAPLATPAAPAEDEPVEEAVAETPARKITPPRKVAKKVPTIKAAPPAGRKAVPTPADLPPAVKKAPAKRAKKAVPPLFDDGTTR